MFDPEERQRRSGTILDYRTDQHTFRTGNGHNQWTVARALQFFQTQFTS